MKPGIEVVPVDTDVLVIGGGLAGCMAGIKASEYGGRVTIAEKANTLSSSCAGTGVDHAWAYVPIIHEKMGWSIEDLIEAEMILHASRARQESRRAPFGFVRADFPEQDDAGWLAFLALRKYEGKIEFSKIPIRQ